MLTPLHNETKATDETLFSALPKKSRKDKRRGRKKQKNIKTTRQKAWQSRKISLTLWCKTIGKCSEKNAANGPPWVQSVRPETILDNNSKAIGIKKYELFCFLTDYL